jgi:hypothetical protein
MPPVSAMQETMVLPILPAAPMTNVLIKHSSPASADADTIILPDNKNVRERGRARSTNQRIFA